MPRRSDAGLHRLDADWIRPDVRVNRDHRPSACGLEDFLRHTIFHVELFRGTDTPLRAPLLFIVNV